MKLILVYDGGCPFCHHFALRSELASGLGELQIRDGRSDHALRLELERRGMKLADGAMLLDGDRAWHGSAAIAELSRRMQPNDALMALLQRLFRNDTRAELAYPALLLARRLALSLKGLPVDPDVSSKGPGSGTDHKNERTCIEGGAEG